MTSPLQVIAGIIQSVVLLVLGYIVMLTGLAYLGRRRATPQHSPAVRFAVIIPAHNEEKVIGSTLQNLMRLDYPRELHTIHVVADNCDDETAALSRRAGVMVHERSDPHLRGKGHALQWIISRLAAQYDAFVILDADTVLSRGFLQVMNSRLLEGDKVIQGRDDTLNVADSWPAGLRFVAMSLYNHVRSLGGRELGLSCSLKGNGMCFASSVLAEHGWSSCSLVEDLEFHNHLLCAGLRVSYAPEARAWAQMPANLKDSRPQNVRWETGRLNVAVQQAPGLLREGICAASPPLIMAAFDESIPPLSVLAAVSFVNAVLGALFGWALVVALSTVSLGALAAHVAGGLIVSEAPKRAYVSLLYAPIYVAWKVILYAKLLLGRRQSEWVRTPRSRGAEVGRQ